MEANALRLFDVVEEDGSLFGLVNEKLDGIQNCEKNTVLGSNGTGFVDDLLLTPPLTRKGATAVPTNSGSCSDVRYAGGGKLGQATKWPEQKRSGGTPALLKDVGKMMKPMAGNRMGATSGADSPLQIVNGQLVVQAQLQQIQTASGPVTVAVLPASAFVKQPALHQLQELLQSKVVSSAAPESKLLVPNRPATPSSPAVPLSVGLGEESAGQNRRVSTSNAKNRPIKPRPPKAGVRASAPSLTPSLPGGSQHQLVANPVPVVAPTSSQGLTVQLSPECVKIVAKLGEEITELQKRGNLLDTGVRRHLAQLEQRRSEIISSALLQQHGCHKSSLNLSEAASSRPSAKYIIPSQQQQMMPSTPFGSVLSQHPPIVNINGQSYMMVNQQSLAAPTTQAEMTNINNSGSFQRKAESDYSLSAPPPAPRLPPTREQTIRTRVQRFRRFASEDEECLGNCDWQTPFSDHGDVVRRLRCFHLLHEPDFSSEFLDNVDEELKRKFGHLNKVADNLKNRFRAACIVGSSTSKSASEEGLLSYLLKEHENDLLVQEKELAATSLEEFVDKSPFVQRKRANWSTVVRPETEGCWPDPTEEEGSSRQSPERSACPHLQRPASDGSSSTSRPDGVHDLQGSHVEDLPEPPSSQIKKEPIRVRLKRKRHTSGWESWEAECEDTSEPGTGLSGEKRLKLRIRIKKKPVENGETEKSPPQEQKPKKTEIPLCLGLEASDPEESDSEATGVQGRADDDDDFSDEFPSSPPRAAELGCPGPRPLPPIPPPTCHSSFSQIQRKNGRNGFLKKERNEDLLVPKEEPVESEAALPQCGRQFLHRLPVPPTSSS